MRLITVSDLARIVKKHGFDEFMRDLIKCLKDDFVRWGEFDKSPRYAAHVPGGVLELMPTADSKYFTFKCVNGHPANPSSGKQTVIATGQMNEIKHGYPLLISEMTTLTAFRTAATAVIATDYLARENSTVMALIGTGAQSEFQTLATKLVRPLNTIRYYDTDPNAMVKYANNMANSGLELIACQSAEEACRDADIITVCTACKLHAIVIENSWIKPGVHISAIGGDCPGKTELEKAILFRGKVVVEYIEQSIIEGEIQQLTPSEVAATVDSELWEIISGSKCGRKKDDEITIFDSVGFAVEDFSALRLTHDLANRYDIGHKIDIVPPINDPKNLIGVLN